MGAWERSSTLGIVIVVALATAACDSKVTSPTTTAPATPTTPVAPATTTTTTPATTCSTTTSSTTTAMTTTSAPEPPTTASLPTDPVSMACATLRSGNWDARRDLVASVETPLDDIRALCSDDLTRTEAARDLSNRVQSARTALAAAEWVDMPLCADDIMTIAITNPSTEPIGVVVATQATETSWRSDVVTVAWSVAPGSTQLITLPHPGTDECWVWAFPFSADPSAVDAALPGADGPPTTGEVPAVWLPALFSVVGASWTTAEDLPGRYASTDVRSMGFEDPLDPPIGDAHPITAVTICPGSVTGPDDDHVTAVFHLDIGPATVNLGDGPEEHPGSASLLQGVYRRGSDGRRRSLGPLIPLTGVATGAGCGPVIPHP